MSRFHGLHADFKPASWRGTCNTDGEFIGVSFDLPDGSILRLALDAQSALLCAETIQDYLRPYGMRTNSHSDSSSGNPSVDVSAHSA